MAKVISQLPSGGSVPKHNNLLGLNEGDYLHLTQFEKAKLDGIQSGAEVNVNTDWNAVSGDAQLLNKPSTFPPSAHTHPISDVTGLPTTLNDLQLNKEDKANKNIANGYAGLDSSGKIIPTQLPALAITDTFVVNSQAAMLALVAEVGDVAVRTDLNKSFILRVTGASTLANWQELLSPTSVDQTIIDGSTNAVSGNAVFDELTLKANDNNVVKLTGNQLISGIKTISNNVSETRLQLTNTATSTREVLRVINPSGSVANGSEFYNNSNSLGKGAIYVNSSGEGVGLLSEILSGSSNTNAIRVEVSSVATIENAVVFNTATNSNLENHLAFKVNNQNVATVSKSGAVTAKSFTKSGGTSSQFLKADGSLDSNTYALASSVHNPVTIGTANGLSLATQQLSLGLASSGVTGALSGTDWNAFNNKQDALGFTPENVANKTTDFTTVNNTLYPSVQAVKFQLDLKANDSDVIHTTGNETKTGRLTLQTQNIPPGTSGLNALAPIVVTGGKGGNNTNTTGTVLAGNGANIVFQSGYGGNTFNTSGTGLGGRGGDMIMRGGDGGTSLGTGTLIPGNGGSVTLQGGTSYGGQGGFAEVKAGNNNKEGCVGANVFITSGWGDNSSNSNPLYDGTVFLGVSASFTPRGNTVIGNTLDDRVNKLQVNGTISASPATTANQVPTWGQVQAAARPYKVYTALLSQTGTDAPTAIILENTLWASITWTRTGVGQYVGTLSSGAFASNKSFNTINNGQGGAMGFFIVGSSSSTTKTIYTYNASNIQTDSLLTTACVEIRVYN